MIRFPDCEGNTALHFGAKNGNFKICNFIIDEAKAFVRKGLGDQKDLLALLNFRNHKGFTPLLSVAFRGYHVIGKKDKAIENRWRIIRALLNAGADMNKTRKETNMTAMHWLAHNNDPDAINELLKSGRADHLILSHDNNLPIDIAGTTPSLESIDVFLEHYAEHNQLQKA